MPPRRLKKTEDQAWVKATETAFGPGQWSEIRVCIDEINAGSEGGVKVWQVDFLKKRTCEALMKLDNKAKAAPLLVHILQTIEALGNRDELATRIIRRLRVNLGKECMVRVLLDAAVILNLGKCSIPNSQKLANKLVAAGSEVLITKDIARDGVEARLDDSIKKLCDAGGKATSEHEVKAMLLFLDDSKVAPGAANLVRTTTHRPISAGRAESTPKLGR